MIGTDTVQTLLLFAVLVLLFHAPPALASSSTITQWRKTLHFPSWTDLRHDFRMIDTSAFKSEFENYASSWSDKLRSKRAAGTDVDPNNRTTVAKLADSHTTLLVHWAGEGSDVIIALAKSSGDASSSALFISRDYGKTFTNVSSQLVVNQTKTAVISNYYASRSFNSYYVFTDEINKCMFTTDNSGENFVRHCNLPFVPRVVKLNGANPRLILAMDDQSQLKELYLSENFGGTWRSVYTHVKAFHWGIPPYDNASTIYVEEEIPSVSGQLVGKVQIVKSDSLFRYSYNTITILTDVVDFELRDEYMYATKSVNLLGSSHNPHIQLWVSFRRGSFIQSEFPGGHVFTILKAVDADITTTC